MGNGSLRQLNAVAVLLAAVLGCLLAASQAAAAGPPQLASTYLGALTQDEEAGPLYFPFSAQIDRARGEIYVVDGKGRVIIYNSSFFPLVTIGKGSGVNAPTSATVDPSGSVYIAQAPGKASPVGRITVLDACLKPLRQINFSGFDGADKFTPQRIVRAEGGRIFAVGPGAAGIVVIEADGKQRLLNPAAREIEGEPHFSALSLDAAGNLYAVSEEAGRVFVLDPELKVVRRFGTKGGSAGKLSRPQGVAADPSRGLFYVVDYMRHSVSVYDASGKYLNEFGGLGLGPGWFQYPKDIALDAQGRLFVVDTFNQRLQVFEVGWTAIEKAASPQATPTIPGAGPEAEPQPASESQTPASGQSTTPAAPAPAPQAMGVGTPAAQPAATPATATQTPAPAPGPSPQAAPAVQEAPLPAAQP